MNKLRVAFRVHRLSHIQVATEPKSAADVAARASADAVVNTAAGVGNNSRPRGLPRRRHRSPFATTFALKEPSSEETKTRSWVQTYNLTVSPHQTILDCLLQIKREQDPTLAFRYSCGHGMCGTDAVAINSVPKLLCSSTVGDNIQTDQINQTDQASQTDYPGYPDYPDYPDQDRIRKASSPNGFRKTGSHKLGDSHRLGDNANQRPDIYEHAHAHEGTTQSTHTNTDNITKQGLDGWIDLAPLPGFTAVRDLITDIKPMLDQIKKLKPYYLQDPDYLQDPENSSSADKGNITALEYLQKPEELAQFELLSTCISCGICEGACPVFVGGEAFIGPAALVSQIRFIKDSRDRTQTERWKRLSEDDALSACQSVRACSLNCPQNIDVGEVIWQAITRSAGQ